MYIKKFIPPAVAGDKAKGSRLPTAGEDRRKKYLVQAEKGPSETGKKEAKFAICLDATSSMRHLIQMATDAITEIGSGIHKESGKIKVEIEIFIYRDYEDGESLLERSGLSQDAEKLALFLSKIHAHGGGDWPEAVEVPLAKILAEGGFDAVMVAGDAASHDRRNLDCKGESQSLTAQELAVEFGKSKIPIHTFVIENQPETIADFSAISKKSGGQTGFLKADDEMIRMAVMAMLSSIKGKKAVDDYMKRNATALPAAAKNFGLLLSGPSK